MNKILALFLIFFISLVPKVYATYGDVAPLGNSDGEINIGDAVVVARMVAGLIPFDMNADVAPLGNPDGEINIGDAVVMARAVAGLVTLPDSSTVIVKYSGTGKLYGYQVSFTSPAGVTLASTSSCGSLVDGVSFTVNASEKSVVGISTLGFSGPTNLFKCTFKDSRTALQTFKIADFSITGSQSIGANGESVAITSSEYIGIILGVSGVIAVSSVTPTSTTTTTISTNTTTSTTTSVLSNQNDDYKYLNTLRSLVGLNALSVNNQLELAATNHAHYMAANNILGHGETSGLNGYTGNTPADRAKAAGYNAYVTVGEVLSSGSKSANDAIQGLFSAIYHRFNLLRNDINEVGLFFDTTSRMFVSVVGNGTSGNSYVSLNPEYVIWPPDGFTNYIPMFSGEIPNPLPDYNVSGNPISIGFNILKVKSISVASFKLYTKSDGKEVTNTRLLNSSTDPNKKFSALQFALFPLDRLAFGTEYQVQLFYTQDGVSNNKSWTFKTIDLKAAVNTIQGAGEEITVASGSTFYVYVPPTSSNPTIGYFNNSYPSGTKVKTSFFDINTLEIACSGTSGSQIMYSLSGGRTFSIKIQ